MSVFTTLFLAACSAGSLADPIDSGTQAHDTVEPLDAPAPTDEGSPEPEPEVLSDCAAPCGEVDLCADLDCDDGNPCTADICLKDVGCISTEAPLACDDDNSCTFDDRCAAGVCAGTAQPVGAACDGLDPCAPIGSCGPSGCQPGEPVNCPSDEDPCTEAVCIPGVGCAQQADPVAAGAPCGEGDSCRPGPTCLDGACVPALPLPSGTLCKSDDACVAEARCSATGECVTQQKLPCDDGNTCTSDGCSSAVGCLHAPFGDTAPCQGACGLVGTCEGTVCVGADPCEALGEPCDLWSCGASGACEFVGAEADGTSCGAVCFPGACQGGVCVNGEPLECFDGNVCLQHACHPQLGCQSTTKLPGYCNADGLPCTLLDKCVQGVCTAAADCNDLESCTLDACALGTCSHLWDVECPREQLCTNHLDDDGDHDTDCLDRACERTDSACTQAHPLPWNVEFGDAGLGFQVGDGTEWSLVSDPIAPLLRLQVAVTAQEGEVFTSASICCFDASTTSEDVVVAFEERFTLPGTGAGCAPDPTALVARTVSAELPLSSTSSLPLFVVRQSYHVLPEGACGTWHPRELRLDRLALDASPLPAIRLRFQGRFEGTDIQGSWEIRNLSIRPSE